jgi:hypothetical protein
MPKKKIPATQQPVLSVQLIENRIYAIRGLKIMLDQDLAELYEVAPRALIQAVKRNLDRFPEDFCFQLTDTEAAAMRSQFVIASKRNIRYLPYAFTEQGIAMLSSVLRSQRAVKVNIAIMRAFVKIREIMATHTELSKKITELEQATSTKFKQHDAQIKAIFEAIKKIIKAQLPAPVPPPPPDPIPAPKNPIGFKPDPKKK